jgi:hypothetical protein
VDAGGASSLQSQLGLTLVSSVLLEMRTYITSTWMTYLLGALQVPCLCRSLEPLCLWLWGCPRRIVGVWSLRSRGPVLGPSFRHLLSTYVVLSSVAYRSRLQRFGSRVLKETLGGMTGVTSH